MHLTYRYGRVASLEDPSTSYMLAFPQVPPLLVSSSLQSQLKDVQDAPRQPSDAFAASGMYSAKCPGSSSDHQAMSAHQQSPSVACPHVASTSYVHQATSQVAQQSTAGNKLFHITNHRILLQNMSTDGHQILPWMYSRMHPWKYCIHNKPWMYTRLRPWMYTRIRPSPPHAYHAANNLLPPWLLYTCHPAMTTYARKCPNFCLFRPLLTTRLHPALVNAPLLLLAG